MAQQDQRHRSGGRSDYGRESGRRDWDPDFGQQGRGRWGRDEPRGGQRWQTGEDRDRYQTGDERRYHSDWDDRGGERTYPGGRSYSGGGYPEEFGYRRDYGREPRYGSERQRDEDEARVQRWRERAGEESGDYYFGTGGHYGGGYGSAPGTRASGQGSYGYGEESNWNERSEWLPETGGTRGTSGNEDYLRSAYGSQSSYGRDYGQRDYGQRYGRGGYGEQRSWRSQAQSYAGPGESYGSLRPRPRSAGTPGGERYGTSRHGQQETSYGGQGWGERQSSERTSYRGYGPKGYTRSDERLKEMICERLTDDPDIDASDLSVDVSGQVVTLSGTVDDRGTKYFIEELVERCGGVKDINNQLRVQSEGAASSGSYAGTAGRSETRTTGTGAQGIGQNIGQNIGQSTGQNLGTGSASTSGSGATRKN